MINDALYGQLVKTMEAEAPNEMCGFLVNVNGKQRWRPVKNVASQPTEHFRIDPLDYLACAEEGKLLAIVHSHPVGPSQFSEADKLSCESSGLPWLLITPGCCEPQVRWPNGYELPVVGRQWNHGSVDCYSTVRDYYSRELGIILPDFDREDDWWDNGQNLYLDHITNVGFTKVEGQPKVGDVILFAIRCGVPNHAGIYIGDDSMLHHYVNQLSRNAVIGGWWRDRLHGFYRHEDNQ